MDFIADGELMALELRLIISGRILGDVFENCLPTKLSARLGSHHKSVGLDLSGADPPRSAPSFG